MGRDYFAGFSFVARDHAVYPRNHRPMMDYDGYARNIGPCGYTMEFWLTAHNGKLDQVSFITNGCACTLACGSIAASIAEGMRIQEAETLKQGNILAALGGLPPECEHCALLAANTLKAACEDYWKCRARARKNSRAANRAQHQNSLHPWMRETTSTTAPDHLKTGRIGK